MATYSLEVEDFSDDDYTLIGIHTTLENYQLAFLLNQYLKLKLFRTKNDLDFKYKNLNSFYSVYKYTDEKKEYNWFLIANVCKIQSEKYGFFNESETKTFLIPERKKVDFFLKLEENTTDEEVVKCLEKINKIPQVITSYKIEANTLKSKEFLIF